MREISRFMGQELDEPSAFDQRVRIFKQRARLETSRASEGEESNASPTVAAAGRKESLTGDGGV